MSDFCDAMMRRNMNIWLITFELHMFIQCIRRRQFDERVFYNEYIG